MGERKARSSSSDVPVCSDRKCTTLVASPAPLGCGGKKAKKTPGHNKETMRGEQGSEQMRAQKIEREKD